MSEEPSTTELCDRYAALYPGAVTDVLVEAESIAVTESVVRTAIEDGVAPVDAYDRFGEF
ncbi:hypothetical protein [Halosolutus halophilus]|uniref:hypothetical protein n=1 Tax=Halosolutus halophilus TaxID=1552990 RepID=UPI00223516FF|nr:hypothetical protein [Halosolutus halophilus]